MAALEPSTPSKMHATDLKEEKSDDKGLSNSNEALSEGNLLHREGWSFTGPQKLQRLVRLGQEH